MWYEHGEETLREPDQRIQSTEVEVARETIGWIEQTQFRLGLEEGGDRERDLRWSGWLRLAGVGKPGWIEEAIVG